MWSLVEAQFKTIEAQFKTIEAHAPVVPRRAIGSCSSNLVTKSLASSGGASSSLGHSITPLIKATQKNYRSVWVVGSILRNGKDQRRIIND